MNPRKSVESIKHRDKRANIPTEELRDFVAEDERTPATLLYPRDPSLDPQLVWKGKDEQDRQDLTVPVVPVYIQEKIHPQALINDLLRQHGRTAGAGGAKRSGVAEDPARYAAAYEQPDLFGDFNGLPEEFDQRVDFYHHEQNWSNRMILGDSLLVMTSLAEKEGLRGKVQCIYFDPPYGIKFGSNWQVSTRKRDVKDGKAEDATRQPEQIRAFRDTWKLGIHSYLAYLRDRLTVARDLLTETGSVFVQIGDENVHLVRCVLDEVFGSENSISVIAFRKTAGGTSEFVGGTFDFVLWYAKNREQAKFRQLFREKVFGGQGAGNYTQVELPNGSRRAMTRDEKENPSVLADGCRIFAYDNLTSQSMGREKGEGAASWFPVEIAGQVFRPSIQVRWKTNECGMERLKNTSRLGITGSTLWYVRYIDDFPAFPLNNFWEDTASSFMADKVYVVQTALKIVERCLLMTTDPGDLVLDPTCGSGTTAYVAEQWGRRWITIDTSRVALALARTRLMAAKYPYYHLADHYPRIAQMSAEEDIKSYLRKSAASADSSSGDIRKGFVYKRVPHVTLKSIANNEEIDAIHAKWTARMEPIRREINKALGVEWEEWQMPRENDPQIAQRTQMKKISSAKSVSSPDNSSSKSVPSVSSVDKLLSEWWRLRRERQREIDASIARRAETETLYDQPYEDPKRVRVCGPFSVESLSPHRVLSTADENQDGTVSEQEARKQQDFAAMILENLRKAGVQNTKRNERLVFETLEPYPGRWLHAAGTYVETVGSGQGMGGSGRKTDLSPLAAEHCRRVVVSIGPEHGTVGPQQVKEAAMEAVKGVGFDLLVVCGFAFDPHVSEEVKRYGKLTVLPAKMNPDLVMGDEFLKKTGAGNLFMVFGEPDVEIRKTNPQMAPMTQMKKKSSVQSAKSADKQSTEQLVVEIKGVDVYDPTTGQIRSSSTDDIACWFIDTDYSGESFFVRQAYFTGAEEPYDKLKRALRSEIDEAAWSALYSTVSLPFPRPESGRIAVKVINHYGDEVLRVFEV